MTFYAHLHGGPKNGEWIALSRPERYVMFALAEPIMATFEPNLDPITPAFERIAYRYIGEYRGSNGHGACFEMEGNSNMRVETASDLIRVLLALKPDTPIIVEDTHFQQQSEITGVFIEPVPGFVPPWANDTGHSARAVIKTR